MVVLRYKQSHTGNTITTERWSPIRKRGLSSAPDFGSVMARLNSIREMLDIKVFWQEPNYDFTR